MLCEGIPLYNKELLFCKLYYCYITAYSSYLLQQAKTLECGSLYIGYYT